jgi:hypothetical protein
MDPYKMPQIVQVPIAPIAPNNNLMKIGGTLIAIFFIIIILIMLYNSFSSSSSTSKLQKLEKPQVFRCQLFSGCDFINSQDNRQELIKKYPDINKDTITSSITIIDSHDLELSNVYVKSIKSEGYIITTYSKPDYTGDKFTLNNDKIEIKCYGAPIRSIKIKKSVQ